jgi:hypothetical protein
MLPRRGWEIFAAGFYKDFAPTELSGGARVCDPQRLRQFGRVRMRGNGKMVKRAAAHSAALLPLAFLAAPTRTANLGLMDLNLFAISQPNVA